MLDAAITALINSWSDLESPGGQLVTRQEIVDVLNGLISQQSLTDLGTPIPGKIAGVDNNGNWSQVDPVVVNGSVGTLQQVLTTGRQTSLDTYLNDTIPATAGNPSTKIWQRIDNLTKTTRTDKYQRVNWYLTQSSTEFSGVVNEVINMGFNISPGGGEMITGKGGIGISFESNYIINDRRTYEYHDWFMSSIWGQVRLMSYTCEMGTDAVTDPDAIDLYHVATRFYIKRPAIANAGDSYFSVLPSANGSTLSLEANEIDKLTIQYSKTTGVQITGAGFNNGADQFVLQGFGDINFQAMQLINNGANSFIRCFASLVAWNQTELIGIAGQYAFRGVAWRDKQGAPVVNDIPAGYFQVFKNTLNGEVRLCVNDGGTIKTVLLT